MQIRTELYLKSQRELLDDCASRLSDNNHSLATPAQYYMAISDAVRSWSRRVVVPHLYTLPVGFSSSGYEYALPGYIRPPYVVQNRSGGNTWWEDVASTSTEPVDGGYQLRTFHNVGSVAGRILWYKENGPLPATLPTVSLTVEEGNTVIAVNVTESPDLGHAGFVKIGGEWISYAGMERVSNAVYNLLNLGRGVYDTIAEPHEAEDTVEWGVSVDDQRLWLQLYNRVQSLIHGYNLHKSSTEDGIRHQQLVSYYGTMADDFWRTSGYTSQRSARFVPQGIAAGGW